MHGLVTFIAKYFVVIPLLCALVVWLPYSNKAKVRFIFFGFVVSLSAIALAKLGSSLYYDPRPFIAHHTTPYFPHGHDNGFPSDHTLLASVFAFVTLRFNKRWAIVAFVATLLVGSARVIAGVHHIADIVGSMLFAAIGYCVALGIERVLDRRSTSTTEA